MLRQYYSEESQERQKSCRSEESIRHHAGSPVEDESNQAFMGLASSKFLRFIVTSKEIHLDPEKVRVIQEMQPPKNLKELIRRQG